LEGAVFPADLVAGRLQALAAAGIMRLCEVAVLLADPAAGWLPLAALDRGEVADLWQVARGSLEGFEHRRTVGRAVL
jgi:hypothetical protein